MSEILYRPKTAIVYCYEYWQCKISCYPQQRWVQTNYDEDSGNVTLSRKNIKMKISIDDFDKNWVFVGRK